jgi:serpin B
MNNQPITTASVHHHTTEQKFVFAYRGSSRYDLAVLFTACAVVWALISLAILSVSCSQPANSQDADTFTPPRALTQAEQNVANASADFGLKLFQHNIRFEAGKNSFVSPLSYAMALGMASNGAVGATRDSMLAALQMRGLNLAESNAAFKSLTDLLLATDRNVEFSIANSIWYNQRYTIEQPFLALARQYFDAEVRSMNFADPASKDIINTWVSQRTKNRINNLIQQPFDPLTDLSVLINAVYFNGAWTYRFDAQNTREGVFRGENGSQTRCQLMRYDKEANLSTVSTADFTMIDIPYSHRQFSMTVILPNEGKRLADVIHSLTPASWRSLTSRLSTTASILVMPKFKLETRYEEQQRSPRELHALGMGIAFDPRRADFSAMYKPQNVANDPVVIGKVIHQTFLQVDERGTEAAAATAVQVIRVTSIGPTPREIRLDRPFAFFIREKNSQAILFAGTLYEPKN